MSKSTKSCTIIGGADGPTSVFIVGNNKKFGLREVKHKFRNWCYRRRREKIKAEITANPHSIDEVIEYMQTQYNAVEVAENARRFQLQRKSCKEALVQKYQPELIGESLEIARPDIEDEQSVKDFLKQVEALQEKAASVSEALFPMEYHLYHIKVENQGEIYFEIEKHRAHFSATSSEAAKGKLKNVQRVVKDIYQYYGVSEQDIAENSERYLHLVAVMTD